MYQYYVRNVVANLIFSGIRTYEPGVGASCITYLIFSPPKKPEILEKLSHLFRLTPRIIGRREGERIGPNVGPTEFHSLSLFPCKHLPSPNAHSSKAFNTTYASEHGQPDAYITPKKVSNDDLSYRHTNNYTSRA